jgi:uncharacterized protein (TIGR02246 family)
MSKNLNWLAILLVVGIANVQAAEMSAEQEWMIKAEIKQLVDQYAMSRDNLDAVGYANVFAESGSLIINGQAYTGRDVIQARVEAVNPNRNSMHVMSTSQIQILDENNATGIHYATIYDPAPDESQNQGGMIAVAGFSAQGKYFDKYQLTDEGWKISERRFQPVYRLAP